MQVWLECCLHGEVQRIVILRDFAAVRFASVISAAAAVDALDGRFFAERTLKAEFDDGTVAPSLPSEHDTLRQERFGFGEMAQAYRESHRTLSLAAAEGAPHPVRPTRCRGCGIRASAPHLVPWLRHPRQCAPPGAVAAASAPVRPTWCRGCGMCAGARRLAASTRSS